MAARILVIEDNPANLELMRYLLAASGYVPQSAADGEQGLEAARRDPPALVICDIQLPGIDGYQVVRAMRAEPALAGIPVIAVTALAMVGDRDRILAAGFDGYLSKPIEPETFVHQVQLLLPPQLRAAPAMRSTEATPAAAGPVPTGRKILAIDNLWTNLALVVSIFEGSGYRVTTAPSPTMGLRLARESPPDLILSDVCMAADSGYDLIAKVKADPDLKAIPFVFITSTVNNEQDRQKGLALGAAKFLFRPIEPQDLLKEIEGCLPGGGA